MQRRNRNYQNVDYQPIRRDSDSFSREQFIGEPPKVPVKSLCFAFFLLTIGSALLITTSLQFTGYISDKYADRTWPIFIMGFIMFLPGAYYTRIGFYAFYRYPGYSYDDIPEFN